MGSELPSFAGREIPDLTPRALVVGPEREEAIKSAELKAGMRCHGCGERIHSGFEFSGFHAEKVAGETVVGLVRVVACARDDCRFALECAESYSVMRMVEYVWVDEQRDVKGAPAGSKARGHVAKLRRERAARSGIASG